MKALCLLALVGFVVGQTAVCFPDRFTFKVSQEFSGFSNNPGFEFVEEFYDYRHSEFRYVTDFWFENQQFFRDTLILGRLGKMFVVEGKKGGGSITCKETSAVFPSRMPCLLQNATIGGTLFVAGDVATQIFHESFWNEATKAQQYQEIGLTVGENAPIYQRDFFQNATHVITGVSLFFDYSINFPETHFIIPSICPQPTKMSKDEADYYLSGFTFARAQARQAAKA
jgi:hypothetical protein